MFPTVLHRNKHWLVAFTALLLAAMVVTACVPTAPVAEDAAPAVEEEEAAPAAAEEAMPEEEAMAGVSPHQAPQWQEMVAAGELPSLEERLPANPKVLEPLVHQGINKQQDRVKIDN